MPAYGTPQSGGITSLQPGDNMALFNAENAAGASIPFARSVPDAPAGTFQAIGTVTAMQVQGANVDVDSDYVNVGAALTAPGFVADTTSRFRFYRVTATGNPCTVIVQR